MESRDAELGVVRRTRADLPPLPLAGDEQVVGDLVIGSHRYWVTTRRLVWQQRRHDWHVIALRYIGHVAVRRRCRKWAALLIVSSLAWMIWLGHVYPQVQGYQREYTEWIIALLTGVVGCIVGAVCLFVAEMVIREIGGRILCQERLSGWNWDDVIAFAAGLSRQQILEPLQMQGAEVPQQGRERDETS